MEEKPQADNLAELLDYFDENDSYLGTVPRKEVHAKGLTNRHVAFYLVNSNNELLLQLRAKDKSVNADQWDKPGGHVSSGEDYSPKELLEEACYEIENIEVKVVSPEEFDSAIVDSDLTKTVVITEIDYQRNYPARRVKKDGTEKIETIHLKSFKARYDGPVNPQPGEVQKLNCFSRLQLEQDIAKDPMKYGHDLKDALNRFGDKIFS